MAWVTTLAQNIAAASVLAAACDATTQYMERSFKAPDKQLQTKTDSSLASSPRKLKCKQNEEEKAKHDFERTKRFVLSFGVYGALPSFAFYQYLLPWMVPGSTPADLVKKVILDNATLNVLLPATMLTCNALQEGKGNKYVLQRVRETAIPVIGLYVSVYIPVDFLMFTVIPMQYQVLFVKSVNCLIQLATSYLCNKELKDDAGEDDSASTAKTDKITEVDDSANEDEGDGGDENAGETDSKKRNEAEEQSP